MPLGIEGVFSLYYLKDKFRHSKWET